MKNVLFFHFIEKKTESQNLNNLPPLTQMIGGKLRLYLADKDSPVTKVHCS